MTFLVITIVPCYPRHSVEALSGLVRGSMVLTMRYILYEYTDTETLFSFC